MPLLQSPYLIAPPRFHYRPCIVPLSLHLRHPPFRYPLPSPIIHRRSHRVLCSLSRPADCPSSDAAPDGERSRVLGLIARCGLAAAVVACGVFVIRCERVLAAAGGVGELILGVTRSPKWPKVLQVLRVFKEQGLVLAALLGLSAFFSMAETSITTLWPWKLLSRGLDYIENSLLTDSRHTYLYQGNSSMSLSGDALNMAGHKSVRELAEKEPEDGVFRMLNNDVTRFLTTILIGTTVVNIGATALVTDAATAIFGEAGVSAATGVMTAGTGAVSASPDHKRSLVNLAR